MICFFTGIDNDDISIINNIISTIWDAHHASKRYDDDVDQAIVSRSFVFLILLLLRKIGLSNGTNDGGHIGNSRTDLCNFNLFVITLFTLLYYFKDDIKKL